MISFSHTTLSHPSWFRSVFRDIAFYIEEKTDDLTKIFSDDSIVDSVKKTPVKKLSPYPSLKIEDAGDKSLDPTFKPEKATRQQREIRKKALNFLEHVSGLLNAAAEFDDRVTR